MIVLGHGVPETAALWDELRTLLPGDTLAVRLPGFGCPRPEGFAATPDAYAGWLIGEIERIGQPVDLVAHPRRDGRRDDGPLRPGWRARPGPGPHRHHHPHRAPTPLPPTTATRTRPPNGHYIDILVA